jgi:hypothetical protein
MRRYCNLFTFNTSEKLIFLTRHYLIKYEIAWILRIRVIITALSCAYALFITTDESIYYYVIDTPVINSYYDGIFS